MTASLTRRIVPVVVLLVLAGTACSAADTVIEAVEEDRGAPGDAEAPAAPEVAQPAPDAVGAPDAERAEEAPAERGAGDDAAPLPPAVRQAGRTAERVVKEGTVTLEVEEGAFVAARERVVEEARRLGGWVAALTSMTDDHGRATASITVRVPVESYEDLLAGVARIAPPVAESIQSEEVTGQIVDLQARLRHLRAQEGFYLGLLEDAEGVQDAIAVQRQVDDIQQRIEQIQGRLDHLEERADYSTLTVEIVEAGAEPVLAAAPDEPSLAVYWQHARNGFVTIIGWALVASVTLAPLALPLVLAFVAWRAVARRRPGSAATVAADAE